MWSMTGAVGQRIVHRAQLSDCAAIGKQRVETRSSRPAGGRRPDPFDVTDLVGDGHLPC